MQRAPFLSPRAAAPDRRRETLRVEAIEREYRAKVDDLRHNYALRITVGTPDENRILLTAMREAL